MKNRPLYQIALLIFLLINAILFIGKVELVNLALKVGFLQIVNVMLCLMCFVTHFRLKNIDQQSPNMMVRTVMMGTILKLFVFAGAALLYATQKKATPIGIPSLLIAMGMYLLYTYIEIKSVLKK